VNLTSCLRLALPICLLLAAGRACGENWPQWRGPANDGISAEKNLPAEWSESKNIAWKLELPGMAGATPAIWGERLFLTSEEGGPKVGSLPPRGGPKSFRPKGKMKQAASGQIVLMCVSTSGKQLWKKSIGPATPWARIEEGNGASPSPSTDGKHVFVFAGNGDFVAFDFDGKEVWRFNAQKRYGIWDGSDGTRPKIQFGMHTTPVLHGDRLYFQLIHSGGGQVIAIDKATGKDVWKVERSSDGTDENEHSYASAFLWKKGKDAYLVTHGNDYTTAHSLDDGKELWRVAELNPKARYNRTLRFVASPVCTPDLIVIPSAKNGPVVGLKPDAAGLVMPGNKSELWRRDHNTPDVPCPLVHDGLVYLAREIGGLLVLDAKTGAELYNKPTHSYRHRASPVWADGKVYLAARDGTVCVVQAGREFKLLAKNKLPDQFAASPAVSGGRIYLRGFSTLWAIEAKE
jgi:outer membrane protein assembly factor BamB